MGDGFCRFNFYRLVFNQLVSVSHQRLCEDADLIDWISIPDLTF